MHKHTFHSQTNIRQPCHEFNAINWICTGKDLYWVVVKEKKISTCVNLKSHQNRKSNSTERRCENTLRVKWKEAAVWHRKTLRQRNVHGSAWTAPGFIWIDSSAVCLHTLNWDRSAWSLPYSITAFYHADSLQWSLPLLSVCWAIFQIWVWKSAAHQGRTSLLHFFFCFLNFALARLHFDKESKTVSMWKKMMCDRCQSVVWTSANCRPSSLTTKTVRASECSLTGGSSRLCIPKKKKFTKRKSSCLVTCWQWSKMEMLEWIITYGCQATVVIKINPYSW